MHIEHTTHDQCRRPVSIGQRAKEFVSARTRRLSADQSSSSPARDGDDNNLTKENPDVDRPVTLWPSVPINTFENICTPESRNSTRKRDSRDGNGNGEENHKSGSRRTCVLLRRASRSAGSKKTEGENLHLGRGKARIVPPMQTASTLRRPATTTPLVQRNGSTNSAARNARMPPGAERGSSQRAKETYRAREDDDSRRRNGNGTGKFQPLLDQTSHYQSSTPTRHDSRSAAAPLSSSERTTHKDTDKDSFQGQRERSTESTNKNNRGKNLWRAGPHDPCRLCKMASSVIGMRGLCRECESDFVRPETVVSNAPAAASAPSRPYVFEDDDEDEVKPPVPLKDKKTLAMRRSAASSRSAAGLERTDARSEKSAMGEEKEGVTGEKEGRYWNENDQAMFMEHEKEKTKKIIADWSTQQQERSKAGEPSKRKEGDKKRRTSFYRFWEDILGCD